MTFPSSCCSAALGEGAERDPISSGAGTLTSLFWRPSCQHVRWTAAWLESDLSDVGLKTQ